MFDLVAPHLSLIKIIGTVCAREVIGNPLSQGRSLLPDIKIEKKKK